MTRVQAHGLGPVGEEAPSKRRWRMLRDIFRNVTRDIIMRVLCFRMWGLAAPVSGPGGLSASHRCSVGK